ncbi:glucoamylase and related glycosyl hydrolase [Candidatus Scalindua japonica]|uniref:Glucoamylase and related glycosyl hydrolase n=2 Tax=Candidatus Scalindua japonica TaxID=1284222 RepID=A0A286TZR9_9BACT|nr:glucoamylase and related glycosyl hydrolase [Candidatus Scalindua japonica]
MVGKDLDPNGDAFNLLKGLAQFISFVQDENGEWVQRYGLKGQKKAIYIQEDNTAYGGIILANYLLTCHHHGKEPSELEDYLKKIKKAIQFAIKNFYREEILLFFSTTGIHESAIEKGYSIWVNHVYILFFSLISQLSNKFNLKDFFSEELSFKCRFSQSVHRRFVLSDRFVRRITKDGAFDLRPDITMLSPVYFQCTEDDCDSCVIDENPEIITKSINFMVDNLWDPELGMLQRYLPFTEDIETHIHAGNGPWIQYTAMLAQYYYKEGAIERGDAILNQIDKYSTEEGYIPEHLSTKRRFEEFVRLEWEVGLDAKKEFHPDIIIPGLSYDFIVEELFFMKKSYDKIRKDIAEGKKEVILFATPLMWSHVEYAKALIARYEHINTD